MAVSQETAAIELPSLPSGSVKDFIPYFAKHRDTPVSQLIAPFKSFESELRKIYAQQPDHEIAQDGHINLVPIFAGHEHELKIRARQLRIESDQVKATYIMSLKEEDRKPDKFPAVVTSFKDFQQNFNLFSESSFSDLDWTNVVAAGSAVTTALLPVPDQWSGSKRSRREYYHEHLAPASDVDLFVYGLSEEQALAKIRQIERNIKDSILHETTTIRTKNAITIASEHPTRHVQIVLRLYDSVSQIITGFDVDCACAAYDGKQVYAAPRAIAAFVTQCNTIDLARRSPSYENRLSKYSHRGFEVHWPLLDRERIDPTIFERSFGRTQGLARLLILEKLPKTTDRESYMDQRRAERGRPTINRWQQSLYKMGGNIKEQEEDEVAEWVEQEEVASYHTMTVPYGPKYNAARINRLLYAKDLLLNAEWNQPDDREVYLHRHPCFFGTVEEVTQDCCGYCPIPNTDEEIKVAEEERKTFISGSLTFLKDDPGRQEIGSFNPITDGEWTTMAYVGDTARLCQAIVDGDIEHVQDWCSQDGVDVNRRDYTGRTPLHLATMASTPEIVQCLIDNGARLIARLVDGRTALHISAARGNTQMVEALMDKSLANELDEDERVEARKAARKAQRGVASSSFPDEATADDQRSDPGSEASEITIGSEDSVGDSMTMGSFVKIYQEKEKAAEDGVPEDSLKDPDIYEIDVIAWDSGLSPLHLAILNGHVEVIELLVSEYGADVLLPVKLVHSGTNSARGAIMTIFLAMSLPTEKAKAVVKLLLNLGATSAQADVEHFTAFHHVVAKGNQDILDILLNNDRPVALSVLNNFGQPNGGYGHEGNTPLTTAVERGNEEAVTKLLALGAKPNVDYDEWVKTYLAKNEYAKNNTPEQLKHQYNTAVTQPIVGAARKELGETVKVLLAHGADSQTLDKQAYGIVQNPHYRNHQSAESVLDIVQRKIKTLKEWKPPGVVTLDEPEKLRDADSYLSGITKSTYHYWSLLKDLECKQDYNRGEWKRYNKQLNREEAEEEGMEAKKAAIKRLTQELEQAEKALRDAGAKTFDQLYPDIPKIPNNSNVPYKAPKPAAWEPQLRFNVADLNEAKKNGYIRLFEAAWNNDLEGVKAVTLAPWSWQADKPLKLPLRIAVTDHNGFSPFSLAVLRGYHALARSIIGICIAQYHKDLKLSARRRWNMRTTDSEDEDCDINDEQELPIYSELVSNNFTIDNIGEVSNIVKSEVLPLTMMNWQCMPCRFKEGKESGDWSRTVMDHAIQEDKMELFRFMMALGAEQQALVAEEEDDPRSFNIESSLFKTAIKLGRTAMLAEMIKSSGAGIPLNALMQKSGVEIETKPRYYQGLSVGGKKRVDWAQAPGENNLVVEEKMPPVLQAAYAGSLDSVEWFMSDAPMRRYMEFAQCNNHDRRIKTLDGSVKGFHKTISTWLNKNNELLLHAAILNNPRPQTHNQAIIEHYLSLIKHVVSVAPETIEQKSSEGFTPLQLAVFACQLDVVRLLLAAGANQRHRDKTGRNIVHTMLVSRHGYSKNDATELRAMISLFDIRAVKDMMVERCTQHPGALTPLAYWMSCNSGTCKKSDVVKVLAEYSTGEDLEMINGEGDLPLHVAVRLSYSSLTQQLLSLNPSVLNRENSTGRTPLEMARDIYICSLVGDPPNVSKNVFHNYHTRQPDYGSITQKSASEFAPQKSDIEESKKGTWSICEEAAKKMAGDSKRRLVSLFEANEVAKRVAGGKVGSRLDGRQFAIDGGPMDATIGTDIISEWMWGM